MRILLISLFLFCASQSGLDRSVDLNVSIQIEEVSSRYTVVSVRMTNNSQCSIELDNNCFNFNLKPKNEGRNAGQVIPFFETIKLEANSLYTKKEVIDNTRVKDSVLQLCFSTRVSFKGGNCKTREVIDTCFKSNSIDLRHINY